MSWVGLPDTTYPSDEEGWANCFSLVKELKIKDDHLYQIPVVENNQLVKETLNSKEITPQAKLSFKLGASLVGSITLKTELNEELQIILDTTNGKILVDRTNAGVPFATDFGTTRSTKVTAGKEIQADLYLDNTVFELYVNGGRKVITGRIFPQGKQFFVESENIEVKKVILDKIY